jgi:hypothetical protein
MIEIIDLRIMILAGRVARMERLGMCTELWEKSQLERGNIRDPDIRERILLLLVVVSGREMRDIYWIYLCKI